MEAIVNVILPVFALILSGYLAARVGILGGESTDALNKFVYFIAMPVLLFHVVATLDPRDLLNGDFIAGFLIANVAVVIIALVVSMGVFRRDLADAALFSMASGFCNAVYLGIPLSLIAFGPEALKPAITASVFQNITLIIPIVLLVELGTNRGTGVLEVLGKLLRSLVKSPILMAPALGLLWSATGWALPVPVDTFAKLLGGAAGPCALFAIGLFLYGKPLHEGVGEVGTVVFLKLLLHPLLTWIVLALVLDVDPLFVKVGVLLAALPTGANCFVLAQQYGRFVQRTSAVILLSTVTAVLILSILLNLPVMAVR
jgi:malonate transporter and related proteins